MMTLIGILIFFGLGYGTIRLLSSGSQRAPKDWVGVSLAPGPAPDYTYAGDVAANRQWTADRSFRWRMNVAFFDSQRVICMSLRDPLNKKSFTSFEVPYSHVRSARYEWINVPSSSGSYRLGILAVSIDDFPYPDFCIVLPESGVEERLKRLANEAGR